jgi:probable phosphoglycerate mutase
MTASTSERPVFATVVCLRHGPLEPRYEQAAIGRTDAAPDPAAAAREAIAVETVAAFQPERVLSSDRRRCEDVARKIAAACGAPHGARRDLRDRDFGTFEGKPWPELAATRPAETLAFLNAFASAAPPGGETLEATSARVLKGIFREAKRHHRRTLAWVADASPIRCLAAHALGLPLGAVQRLKLDPFALAVIRLQADASSITLWNAPADGTAYAELVW